MESREIQNPAQSSPSGRIPLRREWWIAAALIAVTATAGLAASRSGQTSPDPGTGGKLPVAFSAAGAGPVDFSARLDREAVMAGGDGLVMMELLMRGHEAALAAGVRVPTDLVIVLDRSGSMQGEPLYHAKASARELVARLGAQDRFALVSYADGARVEVPLGVASEEARRRWNASLEAIGASGGTEMSSGLDVANQIALAARAPGRSLRVILISDGHANQGDPSREGLCARAARAVSGEFVLSTVGVGAGFDEQLMTAIADAGTGNFYYVRDVEQLASVFGDEFQSARETVARALAVEIEPAPGISVRDAGGYPLERIGERVVLHPGALFAGQERRLWLTLAVDPDRIAAAEAPVELGAFALSFRRNDDAPGRLVLAGTPRVTVVQREAEFFASVDTDAYTAHLASDGLGSLRQSVANAVGRGDRAQALRAIEAFERKNEEMLDGLGQSPAASEPLQEAGRLRDEVEAALAPAAPPSARNDLGKALTAEGQDLRRQGAKRK